MTDDTRSPAERYAAAMARQAAGRTELARFLRTLPFDLDPFQEQACAALEEGRGVLVAAPTGAGKTVIGQFGVHLALAHGTTVMYTTPIKALSNQKYAEFRALHGPERVGLLTGDVTINPHAPVLVMTTEVLRNMLYNESRSLESLEFVVMDEVHYLADRFRGPVWEEVIIHLPPRVQVISLSATVSNAEEFGQWLTLVRGDTEVIVWEHRPVPLWQHVLVGARLYDLYSPTLTNRERTNPELLAAVRRESGPRRGGPRRRRAPRAVVVAELDRHGLLPAIVFVFSRAGCDAAVDQVVASGLRLITDAEAAEIRRFVEERCTAIAPEDLGTLGFLRWSQALERGVAAHHAGLIPLFKETIEHLFTLGLLKVVYATETLALGINMPARSVVLERLTKWDGSSHQKLTPGEYTQLTGRAGRRGIDIEGHAIVVHDEDVDVEAVAGLASKRTYPLRSAFRATYNMSVNLLGVMDRPQAREVLQTSFAQFQADRGVVGLARQVRKLEEVIAGLRGQADCERGDFAEYWSLREAITAEERRLSAERSRTARQDVETALARVRPGDVIRFRLGRRPHHGVVHAVQQTPYSGTILDVVTEDARNRRLDGADLGGVAVLGTLRGAARFNPRTPRGRADLAAQVRAFAEGHMRDKPREPVAAADDRQDLDRLRARLRAHPCHTCPDVETHARWARKYARAVADREGLLDRISHRTGTIAAGFDRICAFLQELGYLGPDDSITPAGDILRMLYSERDLLMAECLREGVWNPLTPAELAGAVSLIAYESRNEAPGRLDVRSSALRTAIQATQRIWSRLEEGERAHGIERTPVPDPGLAGPLQRWAAGEPLSVVLADDELTAGDFVRWSRQVLDVLCQLADVPGLPPHLRQRARAAHAALNRGIVALSSV